MGAACGVSIAEWLTITYFEKHSVLMDPSTTNRVRKRCHVHTVFHSQ